MSAGAGWVHQLVVQRAAEAPGSMAFEWEGGRLTYAELEAGSRRLAARLTRLGVRPESVVAVCADRSPELAIAALAALRSGGAYLPLDPTYPEERLRFMVEDSRASAVLAGPGLRSRTAWSCPLLDVAAVGLGEESEGLVGAEPDAASIAYLIYTSGSTGRPKGVEATHGGLRNLLAYHRQAFGTGPSDRCTLLASVSFDAAVWELWRALCWGATLVLPPGHLRQDPAALARWLRANAITDCFAPTPLLEAMQGTGRRYLRSSALRWLYTGGDMLHAWPADERPRLVNFYGPAEATVISTAAHLGPPKGKEGTRPPPIGHPITNVTVHVLDGGLAAVPAGGAGELYVGGVGLARGYRGRPDLTAERFVPDPFGAGARLYRTGDLGRRGEDGSLEFLGRVDDQVKVRGFRIELAEVEMALLGHPGVSAAAAAVRDGPGGAVLLGYVVPGPAGGADEASLRRHLVSRLPAHMIPARILVLGALPMSPNGKVDRAALPALPPAGALEPCVTPTEHLLAELVAGILGLEAVGRTDDFFDLGGDSLLAGRLAAELVERTGADLTVRTVFDAPTVAELAAVLDGETASARAD